MKFSLTEYLSPYRAAPSPIRTAREGGILRVELNSPDTGNAVTEAMLDDLLAILTLPDPDVRVVVLSGAGEHFSLGGDRNEFVDWLDEDPTGRGIRIAAEKGRRVCEALTTSQAVTIARVQGKAIGAGMALALACDLRVGADTAGFRLPELALGLPTAWGGMLPRLLHEVGAARVRELILTGRPFKAAEAYELSVLQRVVPEDELDAAVDAWAKPIVRRPEAALRVTKALLNSYAAATRLADSSVLDAELMATVAAATRRTRDAGGRARGPYRCVSPRRGGRGRGGCRVGGPCSRGTGRGRGLGRGTRARPDRPLRTVDAGAGGCATGGRHRPPSFLPLKTLMGSRHLDGMVMSVRLGAGIRALRSSACAPPGTPAHLSVGRTRAVLPLAARSGSRSRNDAVRGRSATIERGHA